MKFKKASFVISIVLILSTIFLSILFVKTKASYKEEDLEVKSAEDMRIEEEEGEKKDFYVSVCDRTSCVWISSESLVKEGVPNENGIYQEVLDQVIPHFEDKYGGKSVAKNRAGSFIYWKKDLIPDFSNIFEEVYNAFLNGENTSVDIHVKDLPGTDGKYADRYIEVDDSKQKLYAWIDGDVVKEIKLSAAKEGFQVFGVFPIVDKGIAPIAPGDRYMPYWMAFYYSPKQNSWYGLHALIWWYDEDGRKVFEPETNIGIRRSMGCIRMLVEDAKFLYEIYEKGDPILIHE